MNIEKTIRKQSRDALKKNWIGAVSAFFILAGFALFAYLIFVSLLYIFDVFNANGEIRQRCVFTVMGIVTATIVIAFLLTPSINGFFKYFYEISRNNENDLRNTFYFFFGIKRYFKTLLFNFYILVSLIPNFIVGLLPYYILQGVDMFIDVFPTVGAEQIGEVIYSSLFVLGITIGIMLSLRMIFIEFLYIDDDSKNIGYFFSKSVERLAFKHLKDYIILVFSFIPWFALSLLVLPVLYTIPYFTQSLATSSKWLIKLNKDGQKL
jgi:hypothetical protein